MVEVMVRLLLISLISFPLFAGNNSTVIQQKGNDSVINIKQVGYTNNATVYCGLSNGVYQTHTCTKATINLTTTGSGNTTKAYSQWSNHTDNNFTITQTGDDNYGYLDLDQDDNTATITQNGDDNHGEILMAGDDTTYSISQTGNNKYAKILAFGDDATTTITQSGTGQHNAYVYNYNYADGNTTTITQSGSGDHDADVFWYSDADDGTASINQSGSGDHTARLNFYKDDYNVAVTQSGATDKSFTATYNCVTNCTKTVTITQYD